MAGESGPATAEALGMGQWRVDGLLRKLWVPGTISAARAVQEEPRLVA